MARSPFSIVARLFGVLIVLGSLAAGAYFWKGRKAKPVEFTTTAVSRGDIVQTVTATGGLEATTSVDVSSQVSGLITEIAVDYNTPVKTGQVLARLDPATYRSRLQQAEAQLANTQASHTLVRLNTERTRELRTKTLVSQQDLDQAEALLAQAEAQLRIQTANVESAKVDLGRCTIYAPIDGIVLDRVAEVGKTVAASLNAPTLFTIVDDLTNMQIAAAVAEADIGSIEVGQSVTFTVDAFPSRTFRGRISQIRNAPKTASNVVTYYTIIDLKNDDLKLKPGMTANVSIVVAERPSALRVANSALRVRLPDAVLAERKQPASPTAASPPAQTTAPAMTEEETRAARLAFLREAGFSPGSGPPSQEVLKKAQELAKARGMDIDFSRMGGGRRERQAVSNAPVVRTVFRLVGTDPKTGLIETVSARLGISDGLSTEILDGLKEGDILVTGLAIAGTAPATANTTNPFGPQRNMGGSGGGRR